MIDPDGQFAITGTLLAIWAVTEFAMSVYDTYDTLSTLADPCSSSYDKGAVLAGVALGAVLPGGGYGKLTKNLKRFKKKLPANAGPVRIKNLPGGGKAFQADSAAANIPGSYATYQKQVDAMGNTLNYTKTTYAPDGSIVHVKQKYP